ncbi:hypothetical protein EDB86DRAFT_3244808 [Lactarius hatsudake]|nr:hypothetical protein EDB86DRAFT_3244808 [Lactarius hatsudake]
MAGTFGPNQAQNLVESLSSPLVRPPASRLPTLQIEKQFVVKAVEHAQTYWNLLEKMPPRDLKLTRFEDDIFEHTLREFPEFATAPHTSLVALDEDWVKSHGQNALSSVQSLNGAEYLVRGGSCAAYTSATRVWLALRASGVHIHRDTGDENADVDIATTDGGSVAATLTPSGLDDVCI